MIRVLELFSGTGSVGKVCKEIGWESLSIDIDGRGDVTCDVLEWDYKQYDNNYFDVIWASPPCASFSILNNSNLGKVIRGEIFTKEIMEQNMLSKGDPLVLRTLEIIKYFNPHYWFMENPDTGRLKTRPYMKDVPYHIVDYCMYSNWGYRKRTRIWTNRTKWTPRICDGKGTCGNMTGRKHNNDVSGRQKRTSLDDRYRIPPDLIYSLFLD